MQLVDALASLVQLAFVQGVIAALLALAFARAALAALGVWRRSRRPPVRITVVGVGGAGGNAVDSMVRARVRGLRFVAVNTDRQALHHSLAHERVLIGRATLGGTGTGGDPSIGETAATEDAKRLARAVAGSDIVFVVAGLGGGTGSGAAPVVAGAAKEQGALTVAVVTRPFSFEGTHRLQIADEWAAALRDRVDAIVAVSNDVAPDALRPDASMTEAFAALDAQLRARIEGVVDLIGVRGRVNLDSSHVRAALKDAGDAVVGIGRGRGEHSAVEAVRQAMATAQVATVRGGAARLLVHLAGSSSLAFADVTAAVAEAQTLAAPEANVIFGTTFDRRLKDETVATVIATAFEERRRPSAGTPLRGRGGSRKVAESPKMESPVAEPVVQSPVEQPLEQPSGDVAAVAAVAAVVAEEPTDLGTTRTARRFRVPALRKTGS